MIRRRIFSVITVVEIIRRVALGSLRRLWVLFDIDPSRSRQAQLGAGVLDGLGDQDVAPADLCGSRVDGVKVRGISTRERAAS